MQIIKQSYNRKWLEKKIAGLVRRARPCHDVGEERSKLAGGRKGLVYLKKAGVTAVK